MNALDRHEIEKSLQSPVPEPPEDLLGRILEEIPPEVGAPRPLPDRSSRLPYWKMAAAVTLVLGGGLLAYRMSRTVPTVEEFVERESLSEGRPQVVEEPPRAAVEPGPGAATGPTTDPAADGARAVEPPSPTRGVAEDSSREETRAEPPDDAAKATAAPPPAVARLATPAAPEAIRRVAAVGDLFVTVTDSEHDSPLPGVTLTLRGETASRARVTDAAGHARFLDVAAGSWSLEVRLEGFSSVEYPSLKVLAGRRLDLEVSLAPEVNEVLTVTSESPLLDERELFEAEPIAKAAREGAQTGRDSRPIASQQPGEAMDPVELRAAESAPAGPVAPLPRRDEVASRLRALGYVGGAAVPPSTGGTHEPNDQPYGDMFFQGYGTNPFVDTEDDALSTFGLDVDTGSYNVVRSYLDRGHLPPADAVRVEEMVNAFDYGDPAPRRGDFGLVVEGAPTPFGESERYALVRFGVKARELAPRERGPMRLVFVVDTSGSMAREDRLGLVQRSLDLLVDELEPEDEVGLVSYGSRARVELEPTTDKPSIRRALWRLAPDGATNAEEGLLLGYRMAAGWAGEGPRPLRPERELAGRRVILCSDGVANVGRTGPDSILERIAQWADGGIELTTIGFGMGNYNDVLMERLADQGDGRYAYVDTLDEARRLFVEELTGTLWTIASEARAQVEFDPATVERYRLLGYENRDIADERFRDDTVDAGEIGAGHAVTALYEIKLSEDVARRDRLAVLRLRYRSKATGRFEEVAQELRLSDLGRRWDDAPPSLRLAGVVAELAEILRGSYWAKEGSLERLGAEVDDLQRDWRGDDRVRELADLVDRVLRLAPSDRPDDPRER